MLTELHEPSRNWECEWPWAWRRVSWTRLHDASSASSRPTYPTAFRRPPPVRKHSPCRLVQFSAWHPCVEQTIRAGGSSPRRMIASTALRPCVLRAIRVSLATVPPSRLAIADRETPTTVETCRPSSPSSRITHEAPTSFEPGSARTDSLTRHATTLTLARRRPSASFPARVTGPSSLNRAD